MDDDVEYLGTKFAPLEPLDDPCEVQASVAGITLHVEKCGEKPAHKLTFYRARSSYVNIGRKSGSDDKSMRRENDDHNAVFLCQVVSAKHAKLVLSDSGQVYIVDLHSRHGTHLLRRGETTPKALKPEVETALADGDVLTFGKAVGAGSYLVSPVTTRVELIKGRSSSEIPVSSSDRALTPINSLSHVFFRARKLSSGRYGLFVPSCVDSASAHSSSSSIDISSDGSSSSASEHESDNEDDSLRLPSVLRDSTPDKNAIKIPTFRSFIKEMHNSTNASDVHSPSPPIVLDDADEPNEVIVLDADADAGSHHSPDLVVVDDNASKTRSQSPMELSTPSPSPPLQAQQSEPAIVGAWPVSRPQSPHHSSLEAETAHSETSRERKPEPVPPVSTRFSCGGVLQIKSPPLCSVVAPFSRPMQYTHRLPQPIPPRQLPVEMLPFNPPYKVLIDGVASELKASIKTVEDRIATLHESVEDLKSRQSVTEEDMIDLQSHVDMLEPESERLLCRMNGVERNVASLSLLHGLVNSLRNRLDAPEQAKEREAPLTDVRACAEALNNLVSEMKSLKDGVEKRIEEKMEAMKVAETEALGALKEVTMEADSFRTLKRKRQEEEEQEGQVQELGRDEAPRTMEVLTVVPGVLIAEPIHSVAPIVEDVALVQPPTMDAESVPLMPAVTLTPTPAPEVICEAQSPPPVKRARTAMTTAVHTAAAMAIGAAATWSALAFA